MVARRKLRQEIEPDIYYSARDLARRWGVHQITVFKWASKGVIPKPTKLGPNCSRWKGSSILKHEDRL